MKHQNNLNSESQLKVLNNLTAYEFYQFCTDFVSTLGFVNVSLVHNQELHKITGSGNIELGILSQRFIFLINRNSEINTIKEIDEIRKLLDNDIHKGLLISTGDFSREVKKESKRKGETPIDLIDGENLIHRLSKMQFDLINIKEDYFALRNT